MPVRGKADHLWELGQIFKGTEIAREWAIKAAETRKARKAQLRLPLQGEQAASRGAADGPTSGPGEPHASR
jgi:hypothetical protein